MVNLITTVTDMHFVGGQSNVGNIPFSLAKDIVNRLNLSSESCPKLNFKFDFKVFGQVVCVETGWQRCRVREPV